MALIYGQMVYGVSIVSELLGGAYGSSHLW